MAVSKSLRYEVMRRDGFACRYCGAEPPDVKLHVDHVVPVSLGGTDLASNLVAACTDCNQGKGSTPPNAEVVQNVSEIESRRREAVRLAQKQEAEKRHEQRMALVAFEDEWNRWSYGPEGDQLPRDRDWEESIRRFVLLGLVEQQLIDAVDIAMKSAASPRNKWRYFTGVCWNRVRDLQEATDRIMREDV